MRLILSILALLGAFLFWGCDAAQEPAQDAGDAAADSLDTADADAVEGHPDATADAATDSNPEPDGSGETDAEPTDAQMVDAEQEPPADAG